METTGTGSFTQGGTHPAGKLGEIIGFQEPSQSMFKMAGVDQVIPLRYQVV